MGKSDWFGMVCMIWLMGAILAAPPSGTTWEQKHTVCFCFAVVALVLQWYYVYKEKKNGSKDTHNDKAE